MLEPYDETLDHVPRTVLLSWGEKAVSALERILGPLAGQMIEIHAGRLYVEGVEAALSSRGAEVVVALKGRRIGEQLAWYKQMIEGEGRGRDLTHGAAYALCLAEFGLKLIKGEIDWLELVDQAGHWR